jgi:hypothetical protein
MNVEIYKPKKYSWFSADCIGQMRQGDRMYISPTAIYTDEERRTIWVDMKSKSFSKNKRGSFQYLLKRFFVGTNQDFQLMPINFGPPSSTMKAINLLNDMDFWSVFAEQNKNLPFTTVHSKIKFLINILNDIKGALDQGQEINLPREVMKKLELAEPDLLVLQRLNIFVNGFQKKSIHELLGDNKYSLMVGILDLDEKMKYEPGTEETNIIVPTGVTMADFEREFSHIILDSALKQRINVAMGIRRIFAGQRPRTGGVILIDEGGTGKSLLKSAFLKFFEEKLKAATKERSAADVTSYVNADAQLIKRWYVGGPKESHLGEAELDLVREARNRNVPSLLVIDEAQRFIMKEEGASSESNSGAINMLKKYIQEPSKGGVTGYVLTILVANVQANKIDPALSQGAERLEAIYVGLPSNIEQWVEVQKFFYFDKKAKILLEFQDNQDDVNKALQKIASVLLYHQENVASTERYGISPRRLADYISKYYMTHEIPAGRTNLGSPDNPKWKIDVATFMNDIVTGLIEERLNADEAPREERQQARRHYRNVISDPDFQILTPEQERVRKLSRVNELLDEGGIEQEYGNFYGICQTIVAGFARNELDNNNLENIIPHLETLIEHLQNARNLRAGVNIKSVIRSLEAIRENTVKILDHKMPMSALTRFKRHLEKLVAPDSLFGNGNNNDAIDDFIRQLNEIMEELEENSKDSDEVHNLIQRCNGLAGSILSTFNGDNEITSAVTAMLASGNNGDLNLNNVLASIRSLISILNRRRS